MPSWGWALASFTLSFILAVIGFAVAWGQINQKLLMIDEIKRGLYNLDGTLVYMPAEECEKRREAYEKIQSSHAINVCRKIDTLTKSIFQIQIDMAILSGRKVEEKKNG